MKNTPDNPVKYCHKCKVVLDSSNFLECLKKFYIYRCKPCHSGNYREYHKNNKEKLKHSRKTYKENNKKQNWVTNTLTHSKKRAANKNLPFDLDFSYLISIFTDNCPISGEPFVFQQRMAHPNSPSLDRIVPDRGYVKGNVCVISQKFNKYKSDYSVEDLKKLIAYMETFKNDTIE